MGEWHWNPQVDQIIEKYKEMLDCLDVEELLRVSVYPHSHILYQQIRWRISEKLRNKIDSLRKKREEDDFGWILS